MTRDLAADVNESLQSAFSRLAGHVPRGESRRFGRVAVASAGLPLPLANQVFVFEPPARDDLDAAVAWLLARGVPFQITVAEPASGAVEGLAGDLDTDLAVTGEMPGMAVDSLEGIPASGSAAVVSEVTDTGGLETFAETFAAAVGVASDVARAWHPDSVLTDGELRPFVGRVGGEAVACGMLSRSGDVAGVYTVGVVASFRRRGIGEAVTRALLRAGREAGCAVGALQASELGYRVYERIGFRTVLTYRVFEPAARPDP